MFDKNVFLKIICSTNIFRLGPISEQKGYFRHYIPDQTQSLFFNSVKVKFGYPPIPPKTHWAPQIQLFLYVQSFCSTFRPKGRIPPLFPGTNTARETLFSFLIRDS